MESLRRLFVSSLAPLSASSLPDEDTQGGRVKPSAMTTPKPFALLALPNEIIQQVLGHLRPLDLVELSLTCHSLRSHAVNDLFWARFVQENLPVPQSSPSPCHTWRELYTAHYPYWFLPRHKIWFADKATVGNGLAGQLIFARYDSRLGCIEAYRLVAEIGRDYKAELWEWNPTVLIHKFSPKIRLFLDNPVIKLNLGDLSATRRLHQEVLMQREADQRLHGIRSMLFLSRAIPNELQDSTMSLWPPSIVPATNRVRNESPTMFKGEGHKPQHADQICETNFRLRKWSEFRSQGGRSSVRMGEDVLTFSTLPSDCYTPSAEKPYQGIWVGDYASHGCEFLLLTQRSPEEIQEQDLVIPGSPSTYLYGDSDPNEDDSDAEVTPIETQDPPGCSGRLEAIKLTGDPHVPRGEHTWIAEDIGKGGLIRVADERNFKGARIVKSWSHIAASGFRDDRYIRSQLILISHDSLAMYWEDFGHVSFYTRVNIDDYLNLES
ncbi:hypothetical protein MMC15_007907 [Xylographa vitiligo]|nr:hypothetical protein [Xylographa vitiligo]